MLKGRIVGPPVPLLANGKVRLCVAVELDSKRCVPALLSNEVYPLMGAEVNVSVSGTGGDSPFDFVVVK